MVSKARAWNGLWAVLLFLFLLFTSGGHRVGAQQLVLATHGVGTDNRAIEQEIVEEFEAKFGVDVEIVIFTSAEYEEKVISMILSGNPPDVMYSAARINGSYVGKSLVQSLNPFIERDSVFRLDEYFPSIIAGFTIDGEIYGIPRGNQPNVIFANLTQFAEAGLPSPTRDWTWDGEFLDAARRLTRDQTFGFHDGGILWPVVWAFGGSFLDQAESVYTLNQPPGVTALEFIAALSFEHGVSPGTQVNVGGPIPAFANGAVAMMSSNAAGSANPALQDLPFDWSVEEMPLGPAGRATAIDGAGYSIAATSRNPELAWELLKALTDEAGITSLTRAFNPGQVLPSHRSVAMSEHFLFAEGPLADRLPFIRALEYARLPYVGQEKWPELWSVLNGEAVQPIMRGDLSPQIALDAVQSKINAILEN